MAVDYSFVNCKIHKENIGEHDADNRFLMEEMPFQLERWQKEHPGCTLIGICYEDPHPYCKGFYPMVYEDENGDRFYTHWNVDTFKDYVELGLIK